jgi:hypothetical protein
MQFKNWQYCQFYIANTIYRYRLGTAIAMPKQNCTHKNTQAQIKIKII